jgi:20S proteasome subunit alpha 7
VINRAQEEAANYRDVYRVPISGKVSFGNCHSSNQILKDPLQAIASRIGNYIQTFTLYSSVRPFGCSTLIGVYDHEGPQLYMVEPSGVCWVSSLSRI